VTRDTKAYALNAEKALRKKKSQTTRDITPECTMKRGNLILTMNAALYEVARKEFTEFFRTKYDVTQRESANKRTKNGACDSQCFHISDRDGRALVLNQYHTEGKMMFNGNLELMWENLEGISGILEKVDREELQQMNASMRKALEKATQGVRNTSKKAQSSVKPKTAEPTDHGVRLELQTKPSYTNNIVARRKSDDVDERTGRSSTLPSQKPNTDVDALSIETTHTVGDKEATNGNVQLTVHPVTVPEPVHDVEPLNDSADPALDTQQPIVNTETDKDHSKQIRELKQLNTKLKKKEDEVKMKIAQLNAAREEYQRIETKNKELEHSNRLLLLKIAACKCAGAPIHPDVTKHPTGPSTSQPQQPQQCPNFCTHQSTHQTPIPPLDSNAINNLYLSTLLGKIIGQNQIISQILTTKTVADHTPQVPHTACVDESRKG